MRQPAAYLPAIALCLWATSVCHGQDERREDSSPKAAYFEKHIRPALIEHCLDCHAVDTEASGGLVLDSLQGWQRGGDSGPAIEPGKPSSSRLLRAIGYDDPGLQMPPEGKLPSEVIAAFESWIADGAFDPRDSAPEIPALQVGLSVDRADEHWAYRALDHHTQPPRLVPNISAVDAFITQRLDEAGLTAASIAEPQAIVRRLFIDLTGLPPTPDDIASFSHAIGQDPSAYNRLVDHLLASPRFGEHFARKWMDVARYAESITLRGFVLPEAWRYRDYLIDAYAEDRPFDQMIREQIAGDLLSADRLQERQKQLVATGFLAMGNTNLEQQDKQQLEMDFIDEQLETIGRAFLGQTIGCARCHDHKFDPIPTRDYYALAGVFRSAVALEHENVSKWIEQPLPLRKEEAARYLQLQEEISQLDRAIKSKKKLAQPSAVKNARQIPVSELPGVVVDSTQAKLVGEWVESAYVGPVIGPSYLHDDNRDRGQKTATLEADNLSPGDYQVRLAYTANNNRSTKTQVRVFSADGEKTVFVNQRLLPTDDGLWVSLGEYRFEKDGQAFVLVSNEGADGHVIVDAVQFLPLEGTESKPAATASPGPTADTLQQLTAEIESLEKQKRALQQQYDARPKYLTVVEKLPPQDIPVHVRGDVHNLGPLVPRGFLTAVRVAGASAETIPSQSSGRLEFARWLTADDNPLTARVYANRVWCWLMGQGLVSTVNNFGTTGTQPSHPELLDWLACELVLSEWSTKHLVRQIVLSEAYRRSVVPASHRAREIDPQNRLYWRGQRRSLSAEALRDAMLQISGELDLTVGGSLIQPGTKDDYNYQHSTTRRSVYHPVLRNSLPELFEAFDFADTSVSVGQRARSTVATQALVLMNHPWVLERVRAATQRLRNEHGSDPARLIDAAYQHCLGRLPSEVELAVCVTHFRLTHSSQDPVELLLHSLFASLDFRYLE